MIPLILSTLALNIVVIPKWLDAWSAPDDWKWFFAVPAPIILLMIDIAVVIYLGDHLSISIV